MARIKKGDLVKFISGARKGTTGKVTQVNAKERTVLIDGVGIRHRHLKPTMLNPTGGHKDVQAPVPISKVALVIDPSSGATSRVGLVKNADGGKTRVARQAGNKEIK